ncbi:MAG: PDZ domain-containing protein [Coriobacteriia bacterium]|nr:PDZ domain-containing protein [Coriobacteriia bacterium]
MNEALSAILWGIPTFSLLVLLHEGGHFAVARMFGIKVHEFMLGLPGPAIRFRGKKTTYGVTAVPLGGYVRIAGMEPGPEDPLMADALAYITRLGTGNSAGLSYALDIDVRRADTLLATLADWDAITVDETDPDNYVAKAPVEDAERAAELLAEVRTHVYRGLPAWKRIAILSAGVIVNLVAALLVFVVLLAAIGVPMQSLTLKDVTKGSAAAKAGIVAGDTIVALDGKPLADWQQLLETLGAHKPGDVIAVTYASGETQRIAVATLGKNETGGPLLGVVASMNNVRSSVPEAFKESMTWIGMVFVAIAGFFNPNTFQATVSQSSSIVGASVEVARAAEAGPLYYAWIVALLSLSLGVINVLPIPPLDGGKIALEIIERIAGRPLPRNLSIGISAAGALMLFGLIGYLMYSDILRYVVSGG